MKTSISRALITSVVLGVLALGALMYFNRKILKGGAEFEVQRDQVTELPENVNPEVPEEILEAIAELEKDEPAEVNWSPKIQTLKEILDSRNDNDPRLDSEFKDLNRAEKQEIRAFYRSLEWEDRNGRGTAVFLLGRSIKSEEDVEFFVEVLSEPPCLSMRNCELAEAEKATGVDDHDNTQEITLAYPQMVALKSLEREFTKDSPDDLRDMFFEAITVAAENQNKRVSKMAQGILAGWNQ